MLPTSQKEKSILLMINPYHQHHIYILIHNNILDQRRFRKLDLSVLLFLHVGLAQSSLSSIYKSLRVTCLLFLKAEEEKGTHSNQQESLWISSAFLRGIGSNLVLVVFLLWHRSLRGEH